MVDDQKQMELEDFISCNLCPKENDLKFCEGCNSYWCDSCWPKPKMHRRQNNPGAHETPHEKSDPLIVKRVNEWMAAPEDEQDERAQHENDEDTIWLGWDKDSIGDPILAEYRRYASIMMETAQNAPMTRYPGLVSFVGPSGAGKSTLIRLLMDSGSRGPGDNDTTPTSAPIIGRGNSIVPTSSDVHLYIDRKTRKSERPILFADCEGFEGGERNPVAKEAVSDRQESRPVAAASNNPIARLTRATKRGLRWASRNAPDYEKTGKRQYAVAEMYPRIFHAFSDVIVFVLNNPNTMEDVVEKLLEWADQNHSSSINLPSKPHAVIALNKSNNSTADDQWNRATATEGFLNSMDKQLRNNPTFERYVKKWQDSGKDITLMREMFECYYAGVHVMRLPDKSRYQKLHEQRNVLYNTIVERCESSFEKRKNCHMLADVDQFGLYLSLAFDHFSETLDEPFDYVQASRKHRPPPETMSENIFDFVELLAQKLGLEGEIERLFGDATDFVASCIMLDASRKQLLGRPIEWFGSAASDDSPRPETRNDQYEHNKSDAGKKGDLSYLALCKDAIDRYYLTRTPCKFGVDSSRNFGFPFKCVAYKNSHGLEHRQKSKWGGYRPFYGDFSHTFEPFKYHWEQKVRARVTELNRDIQWHGGKDPRKVRAAAHTQALKRFYASIVQDPSSFISHSICLCCLSNPPQYRLNCGHVICLECALDYGQTEASKRQITLECCPIHNNSSVEDKIYLTPEHSGLRILTLDGGGIRGIVELCILEAIESQLNIPLNNLFDLVVGTSTGGIIALGFGHKRWSVSECIEKFQALVKEAFTLRQGQNFKMIRHVELVVKKSKYETKPLESALRKAFEDEQLFASGNVHPKALKVAVTTTTEAGTVPHLFSNYNVGRAARSVVQKGMSPLNYHRHRPGNPSEELKIWQVARATSAAPGFFKPFACDGRSFMDGGFLHNNPILVAMEEAKRLAVSHHLSTTPDIVLSLGTCLPQEKTRQLFKRTSDTWRPCEEKDPQSGQFKTPFITVKTLLQAVKFQIRLNVDSQYKWEQWTQQYADLATRAFRVNPDLGDEPPSLDAVDKVTPLRQQVAGWLLDHKRVTQIKEISCTLVASSFYFEPFGQPEKGDESSIQLQGFIRCRLSDDASDIKALGTFLGTCTSPAHFVVENSSAPDDDITIPVQSMMSGGLYQGVEVMLTLSSEDNDSTIALKLPGLGEVRLYPLSGFPRNLMKNDFAAQRV
ncbi:hypothetical protein LQW54_001842 [Pestalotiopsis sp. IQ-011]